MAEPTDADRELAVTLWEMAVEAAKVVRDDHCPEDWWLSLVKGVSEAIAEHREAQA